MRARGIETVVKHNRILVRLRFDFAVRHSKHSQQTDPPIAGISPLGFASQAQSLPLRRRLGIFSSNAPNVPRDWE
jgi:hypothetical protein